MFKWIGAKLTNVIVTTLLIGGIGAYYGGTIYKASHVDVKPSEEECIDAASDAQKAVLTGDDVLADDVADDGRGTGHDFYDTEESGSVSAFDGPSAGEYDSKIPLSADIISRNVSEGLSSGVERAFDKVEKETKDSISKKVDEAKASVSENLSRGTEKAKDYAEEAVVKGNEAFEKGKNAADNLSKEAKGLYDAYTEMQLREFDRYMDTAGTTDPEEYKRMLDDYIKKDRLSASINAIRQEQGY